MHLINFSHSINFSNISTFVSNHIAINHSALTTRVAAAFLAVVVVEAALSLIGNGIDAIRRPASQLDQKEKDDRNYDISANLGSVFFYSMCAANIIPGSAKAALGIFTVYSLYRYTAVKETQNGNLDGHDISIRRPLYYTSEAIGRVGHGVFDMLRNFTWHPVWLGVIFMGVAISVYVKTKG